MTGTVSRILYFDCFSGVSGDMVLGALVDLGVDIKDIRAGLKSLDLKGYRIEATVAKRGGITGTKVNVKLTPDIFQTSKAY
jgi:pyridinium-3,5-bisthiocarboxylic acid mononucleotide nickel chelatase